MDIIMNSFFEKLEIKPSNYEYYIKYDIPIDFKIFYFLFDNVKPQHYNKITEILNCCDCFSIEARLIHLLPNNFIKKEFTLIIWNYNGEKLPENWIINEVRFHDPFSNPIINDDFKINNIIKLKKLLC